MITRTKVQVVSGPVPASNNLIDVMVAGDTINGQRVLMTLGTTVIHFDPTNDNNYSKIVGISNQAAIMGDPIDVVTDGVVTSPGWGLIPDTVYYADLNGLLTSTPPTSGISVIIGVSINGDSLKLLISNPVITA